MNVQKRIKQSIILEEMKKYKEASKRLGLKDVSTFKTAPLKTNTLRIYSMKWSSSGWIDPILKISFGL